MMVGVETFTAVTYGLLALVSVLYLVLLRAFLMDDPEEPEDPAEIEEDEVI